MSEFVTLKDVKKIYQMGEVEIMASLVGSEMCIRDSQYSWRHGYGI